VSGTQQDRRTAMQYSIAAGAGSSNACSRGAESQAQSKQHKWSILWETGKSVQFGACIAACAGSYNTCGRRIRQTQSKQH
jgi:hypothetical protein